MCISYQKILQKKKTLFCLDDLKEEKKFHKWKYLIKNSLNDGAYLISFYNFHQILDPFFDILSLFGMKQYEKLFVCSFFGSFN